MFQDFYKSIIIKDYAWIRTGAIILPGVTIGEGAVVEAGVVVSNDVSQYTVVGGVPESFIRERNQELVYVIGKA